MQIESEPRGRRAFLAAAIGAGLASAIAAVRPPESVRAADPNDVVLGAANVSATTTVITNSQAEATTAFRAVNTGTGVALEATAASSPAVQATSANHVGVLGTSTLREGVVGETASGSRAGVVGSSPQGTGVMGASANPAPNAKARVGVFGYAVQGEDSIGVFGESGQGTGVHGKSPNGTGTFGQGSTGVHGDGITGVLGSSNIGAGVEGASVNSVGVYGHSDERIGVVGSGPVAGVSATSEEVGVFATSLASQTHPALIGNGKFAGPGVAGFSGTGKDETNQLPSVPDRTGVYGYAAQSSAAAGVVGETTVGTGVVAKATSGTAVKATSTTGFALSASGRIKLEKAAGVATITAGTNNVLLAPGIDITGTSSVIATLNGSAGGTTTVQRVQIYTASNQIRIWLTANTTADVKVAWLVIG